MLDELKGLPPLKEIINFYGLNAKKSLGQNFLLDLNLTDKIVRSAINSLYPKIDIKEASVVEIGPGPGGLTRAILGNEAKKLYALEKDKRCVEALSVIKDVVGDKLEIIEADALDIKISEIADKPVHIMANLPYNISTKLLTNWLLDIEDISSMTLMFQKEVAERITAEVGTKKYGRLSILSQWLCDVVSLFDIPPSAFTPPPKVTSTVVHFRPKAKVFNADFTKLEKITEKAFGQRRKMLRSSLKSLGNVEEICLKANIDPSLRAEQVDVEGFCRLANAI